METFNQYVDNLNNYYSSIAQGDIRPLVEDAPYTAEDMAKRVEAFGSNPKETDMVAFEIGLAALRAHNMKTLSPSNYYTQYRNEARSKRIFYNNIVDQTNLSQRDV